MRLSVSNEKIGKWASGAHFDQPTAEAIIRFPDIVQNAIRFESTPDPRDPTAHSVLHTTTFGTPFEFQGNRYVVKLRVNGYRNEMNNTVYSVRSIKAEPESTRGADGTAPHSSGPTRRIADFARDEVFSDGTPIVPPNFSLRGRPGATQPRYLGISRQAMGGAARRLRTIGTSERE
jgi:hypothetical protein